jgi:hypothetical protein
VTVPPVVAVDEAAVAPPRPVRIRYFVRLKLHLIGNGLRASTGRAFTFALGVLLGMMVAAGGFGAFLASGLVSLDAGLVLAVCAGSALVLGWVLVPVLFFGVDETLDPARFALYPLPRRTLAMGMLAAACAGIPAVATALALLGLVFTGAARAGVAGALVGLVGAVLSLAVCILASRAVTSSLAALLRSRRMRDLTGVVVALLGASIGPPTCQRGARTRAGPGTGLDAIGCRVRRAVRRGGRPAAARGGPAGHPRGDRRTAAVVVVADHRVGDGRYGQPGRRAPRGQRRRGRHAAAIAVAPVPSQRIPGHPRPGTAVVVARPEPAGWTDLDHRGQRGGTHRDRVRLGEKRRSRAGSADLDRRGQYLVRLDPGQPVRLRR